MTARRVPSGVPGPCDPYAEAAALRVDRELGPAEAAALEAHLVECAPCRRRAREAEAVSSVLHRWDAAHQTAVRAPARLRLVIRAAVADTGRWRAAEARLVRRLGLATAASVLVALGAGVVLGLLGWPQAVPGVPPRSVAATTPGAVPRPPAVAPLVRPAPERPLPVPSRLRRFLVGVGDLEPRMAPAEREVAVRYLATWRARQIEREAVERVTGEAAVWWRDPLYGEERLITVGALAHLRARGADDVETFVRSLEQGRTLPAPDRPRGEPVGEEIEVDLRVRDVLGLPTGRSALEATLRGTTIDMGTGDPHLALRAHLLPAAPLSRALPPVDGLPAAVGDGTVQLEEGSDDDLVAIVRGTRRPVYVPAGEIVAGGRVDRLVARATWLPATDSEARFVIPCVAASTPAARHGDVPVPTGMVAGPAVRGLLARGAPPAAVRAHLAEHIPLVEEWGRDWSLLTFHDPARLGDLLRTLETRLLEERARGFVVEGPDGGLRGIEVTELPPESAAPLLARLLVGYSSESAMEAFGRRLGADADAEVPAAGLPLLYALRDLAGSPERFRARVGQEPEARAARAVTAGSQTAVELMERVPRGVVHASGLSP